MAEQHFYSRVPARVSMYNKYDGFDTFAHSAGLTREFIERELAVVYADKLSKNDVVLVRRGEISPVYYQCCVRSGSLVQGCITYLPLDYTLERSAYLTHTLVFSEEERKELLYSSDKSIFNHQMYKKDISEFNITSPTVTPNSNYPTIDYDYQSIKQIQGNLKKYDSEIVKNFIGSLILALCKKGKNVFFKLDVDDQELSLASLKVISEVISILPYSLRSAVSFITYLNDPLKYPNFKLKCLSSKVPEVALEKGVFIDFKTGLITGLSHEDIVANKTVINFFYSLLDNNEIRIEFLNYIDRIVETIPSARNLNIKTLSDLVFLFCHTSGFYLEEQVLPGDEQVYEAFCIYEKYRSALNDEYRSRVYKCLTRYVNHHVAIPKDIFSKVMRLYPGEIKPAKRIVMNVVLDLIHTDIMREKLFVFISNNYQDEDEDIKKVINTDLCRVFYGGFMQNNILKFFNNNFENEPIETQNQIIEKLLLSIRTVSIQNAILEFFDVHYDVLSENHIEAFYNTFFEMLVECDNLAVSLVRLVNKHVEKESDDFKHSVSSRLANALEADYRRKEHLMLPILMNQEGFCINSVISLIFKDWANRKVFVEYLEILKEKPLLEKTDMFINDLTKVGSLSEEVNNKLIASLEELFANALGKALLYDWLEVDEKIKEVLKTNKNVVLSTLKETIVLKGVALSLKDTFNIKHRTDGIEVVLEYSKTNTALRTMDEYKIIADYLTLIEFIKNQHISKAFEIYNNLTVDKKIRSYMSDHLNTCIIDRKEQAPCETIYYDILVQVLKTETIVLDKLYLQYKDVYKRAYFAENGTNANPKKAQSDAVVKALKLIFDASYNVTKASESICSLICKNESKLRTCIMDFMNNYDSSAKKWLNSLISNVESCEFIEYFKKTMNDSKPQNNSFFGKLFGKK